MLQVGQPTQYSPDGVAIIAATILEVGVSGSVNVAVWENLIPTLVNPTVKLNVQVASVFPQPNSVNGTPPF